MGSEEGRKRQKRAVVQSREGGRNCGDQTERVFDLHFP